jgi:hypothetical protein
LTVGLPRPATQHKATTTPTPIIQIQIKPYTTTIIIIITLSSSAPPPPRPTTNQQQQQSSSKAAAAAESHRHPHRPCCHRLEQIKSNHKLNNT